MRKKIIIALLTMLVQMQYTNADTIKGTVQSTAQLSSSCTIAATGFSFGNLNSGVQNVTSGDFNTQCTKGTAYTIKFGWGSNIGTAAQCNQPNPCPRMARTDNSDYIPYYIMMPDNYYAAGDGTYGHTYSATGTGSLQTLTLNAKTVSNYYAKPGNYIDNLSVSIIY